MSTKRQRAALYHRVSTADQNQDAAHAELHAAAQRYGLTVALDVQETGSGASNDRPGLAKVMAAAQRGHVDTVLVWKLDRFGRSALDLLTNLRTLENAGVRFVAVTQGIDVQPGGEAMSRLLLTMLSAVAEFERSLIVERTRLGLARARANGKRLGRPSVPRPPSDQVRELRAKSMTWPAVAKQLGCTVWAAREAAEKGAKQRPSRMPAKQA